MTKALRKFSKWDRPDVVARRLQGKTMGLGYWAAHDFMQTPRSAVLTPEIVASTVNASDGTATGGVCEYDTVKHEHVFTVAPDPKYGLKVGDPVPYTWSIK